MTQHYSSFGEAAGAAMAHNARQAARHNIERATEELPARACPPGCPGCNAPGGIGECGPEDRAALPPREALSAPQTAEHPAPGHGGHPGGENGPHTGTQDRAELHRQFKDAITRRWDVGPFVIDEIVDDAVDCHLDLVARATGGAPHPADEERRQRYADAVRSIVGYPSDTMIAAVMAVADAEQAELRAQLDHARHIAIALEAEAAASDDRARTHRAALADLYKAALRAERDLAARAIAELRADCQRHSTEAER